MSVTEDWTTTNTSSGLRLGRPTSEETTATAAIQSAGVAMRSEARQHMEIGSLLKGIMRHEAALELARCFHHALVAVKCLDL